MLFFESHCGILADDEIPEIMRRTNKQPNIKEMKKRVFRIKIKACGVNMVSRKLLKQNVNELV